MAAIPKSEICKIILHISFSDSHLSGLDSDKLNEVTISSMLTGQLF